MPSSPFPGALTVLLVEDDAVLRETAGVALRDAGYNVLDCAGSAQALDAARNGEPIHALVTDVSAAGMGGVELAIRLTSRFPGLRVLYTSPYAEVFGHGEQEAVLHKPFSSVEIVGAVQKLLEGPRLG